MPDEVTSVGRIMQFPPLDLIPEGLRGKSFAIVHAYESHLRRDSAHGRRARSWRSGHGALDRLPGEFVYFGVGLASSEDEEAATRRSLHRVTGSLRPHRSGSYLNFEEDPADPASFYSEDTYRRLRAVKAAVDPEELILANHPIRPAGRS